MLATIKNNNKQIKKHRLLFLLYCIIIGFIANSFAVSFPIAVPLCVGNVAILVTLARLGPLWAIVCFAFVVYPLPSDIAIALSIIQIILFRIHIKNTNYGIIRISTIYFLVAFLTNKVLLPEVITDNLTFLILFTSLSTALFFWSIKAVHLLLALYVNAEELRKQSLQHQLSFRVGLYTAIPATLLITLGLNGITSLELVKQIFHYQKETSSLRERIELKLNDYKIKVETVVKTANTELTTITLKRLVEQSPEFISSLVTDDKGFIKAFYKRDANNEPLTKVTVADRPYFNQAKKTNSSYISDTFRGRTLGDDQLFAVSTPIIIDNNFNGILQLAVKLDYLLQVFDKRNDKISHRILIDNTGNKVWGNNISGNVGNIWNRPKDSKPMMDTFLSKSVFNPLMPIVFSEGAYHLVINEKIGLTGWSLYFFIDTNDLVIKFSIYFALALALITLILEASVRLSNEFLKNYTQALEELVYYTQQWDGKSISNNSLTFTQSALEIDTLAHSFANMQRRVATAHHAMISTMNDVKLLNEELEERVEHRTKELERERDKANQLAAIKTRFLANMSHEIRTPITIIKGFTEQILPKTQGDVYHALCKIEQNTLHLQNVINDILDAAKIDEGKMTIAEQAVAIYPFLSSLSESMEVLARPKKLKIEVNIDIAKTQYVMTDPYRLKQILLNFISNAIKFTVKGRIKLIANITNKNELYIAIIDEGIGISDQQASKLFEAFTQADSSTSRDYGGTGLGLFISKQLADAMSIKLTMQSKIGIGSCFAVTLPKNKIIEDAVHINKHDIEIVSTIPNWSGHLILIVDDVEDIRELISLYLKDTKIAIDFGQNGQQAIQLAQQKNYDLIILDQQMPIMDGLSAAKIIRELNKNTPLLSLSADILDTDGPQPNLFNKSIAKPFTKSQLISSIKSYINNKQDLEEIVNEEAEDELKAEYLQTLPKALSLIEQLINNDNKNNLERELHKLKGTSACLGLTTISICAANLQKLLKERMIKKHELHDLSMEIDKLLKK
ncbi:ATP-binding protein [Shewanella septentrionalis]|uniref:histidine kinase n=1 Tax=Shewanella septentrionalis TaxID=2952223 RepID=A0A9X2WR98_9GAMM|nr:ATP-binding protein [Shewanella septentrionalis]MCT7943980.1 ATP-binding protein [Shewanella septentrionalis]